MKQRLWRLILVSGLLISGCTRVAVDPCARVSPPVAAFRVSPESGELPALVTFDASDSLSREGDLISYRWDFGDGRTGEGRVVEHRFDRDPRGPEEEEFRVTLTVTQEAETEYGTCRLVGETVRVLRYGVTRPLDVVQWEAKATYYGTLIEGVVRNVSTDLRVTHGRVIARFHAGPEHALVAVGERELWDIRPGEERLFMIPTYLWPWQFDWVELQTEAFTAQP